MIEERPIDDLLGEALRRHRHGLMRPLWRDMPEGAQKEAWRRAGAELLERDRRKMSSNEQNMCFKCENGHEFNETWPTDDVPAFLARLKEMATCPTCGGKMSMPNDGTLTISTDDGDLTLTAQ